MAKTPNPGILRALISASLRNGLRFDENDPLFDRKLLEYLHELGVRIMSDKCIPGLSFPTRKMYYSGPCKGSDWHFPVSVSRFLKSCVHHPEKYCLKRLFSKNTPFNGDLILLFSGLLLTIIFGT
jgi:hypothetical protein